MYRQNLHGFDIQNGVQFAEWFLQQRIFKLEILERIASQWSVEREDQTETSDSVDWPGKWFGVASGKRRVHERAVSLATDSFTSSRNVAELCPHGRATLATAVIGRPRGQGRG
ncbi:hypothetical protein K0M31_018293 [Melipona bicolor]|uniref:Uncharacterized protein n=1 Tax=Melipona bicolor TaxID=60889 RepID=A0AA40KDY5_9HYME|nr:hypothetical protein K0M31_018293 [Melipona bicolor]